MTRQLARLAALGGVLAFLALLTLPVLAAPSVDSDPSPDVSTPAPVADTPGVPTPWLEVPSPEPEPPLPWETSAADDPSSSTTPAPEILFSTPSVEPQISSTETPNPTSELPSETPDASPTTLSEPTPTGSDSPSPTLDPTSTYAATETLTASSEIADAAIDSPSFGPGAVLINEVAWAGTDASANDEWIELWNPNPDPIDLTGWTLTDSGDLTVPLYGEIPAFGFYLLERTDDDTISDIAADRVYTGALANTGEAVALFDPSGNQVDTANQPGGPWPGGGTEPRASMERHSLLDLPGSWRTFAGPGFGLDAAGNPIRGTPRQPNSPASASVTPTPLPSATPSPPGVDGAPFPAGAILINEVAWAGTSASASDEWIELFHPGSEPVALDGWLLTDEGDLVIALSGTVAPGGFYLLERTDDDTVSDIAANRVYTGALANGGETLRLLDPTGAQIDVVNPGGGAWPAGDAATHASMERGTGWRTFSGYYSRGLDADGRPIRGTPGGPNSILFPVPTATGIPGRVVINELLIRPRYDWEGTGGVSTGDEFIELLNRGPGAVNLRGWTLDDVVEGGSAPFELPALTLEPGAFAAFFRSRTGIALNDGGDSIRLSTPDGRLADKVRYLRVRAANLSFGRLPDGDEVLAYGLWPTPGETNERFQPPTFAAGTILISEVAWAGTDASPNDEWIELWNPGTTSVNLFGWTLTDDGDLRVYLNGTIDAGGFFLLERGGDRSVADVPADLAYRGALANGGERLRLLDPSGAEIDIVNPAGGAWPGGDPVSRTSMARTPSGWASSLEAAWLGHDAGGRPIRGSPRAPNEAAEENPADAACSGVCP